MTIDMDEALAFTPPPRSAIENSLALLDRYLATECFGLENIRGIGKLLTDTIAYRDEHRSGRSAWRKLLQKGVAGPREKLAGFRGLGNVSMEFSTSLLKETRICNEHFRNHTTKCDCDISRWHLHCQGSGSRLPLTLAPASTSIKTEMRNNIQNMVPKFFQADSMHISAYGHARFTTGNVVIGATRCGRTPHCDGLELPATRSVHVEPCPNTHQQQAG